MTSVDWRNPHVHVFVNVTRDDGTVENWAVELESTVLLDRSGWAARHVEARRLRPRQRPRRRATARARSGASASSRSPTAARSTTSRTRHRRRRARSSSPTPRGSDGKPLLGAADASGGYWAYPTSTVLMQAGANVRMNGDGVLARLADAPRVAPFQPWALGAVPAPPAAASRRRSGLLELQESGRRAPVPDAVRRAVRPGPGAPAHLRADRRRQPQLPHHLHGRPRSAGPSAGRRRQPALLRPRRRALGRRYVRRARRRGSTRTSGSRTAACRTRTSSRSSSASRVPTTTRYDMKSRSTIPGAYTQPWSSGWELKWVGGEELPVYFCQDNRS